MVTEADVTALMDMAAMQAEPLHPDLMPYLTETEGGMPLLGHPLVHDLMPVNGHANRAYAYKTKALAEAKAAQHWHTVVFLHERPYRCAALIDYVLGRHEDDTPYSLGEMLDMSNYADIAETTADVWTDSENIHQHVEDWLAITEGHVPGAPLLMGDQPAFDLLPADDRGRIEVWRGDCADGGWSWSTERKVAEFFSNRWDAGHRLLHGFVDKRYVFGYITARSEFEVMVRREHVELAPC